MRSSHPFVADPPQANEGYFGTVANPNGRQTYDGMDAMPTMKQLRSKRVAVNAQLQSGQTAELITMTMALQSALRTALEHLAAQNGFSDGPWLQALEKTLLDDASNIWSEGVHMETEASAMNVGKAHLAAIVDALRLQLEALKSEG